MTSMMEVMMSKMIYDRGNGKMMIYDRSND